MGYPTIFSRRTKIHLKCHRSCQLWAPQIPKDLKSHNKLYNSKPQSPKVPKVRSPLKSYIIVWHHKDIALKWPNLFLSCMPHALFMQVFNFSECNFSSRYCFATFLTFSPALSAHANTSSLALWMNNAFAAWAAWSALTNFLLGIFPFLQTRKSCRNRGATDVKRLACAGWARWRQTHLKTHQHKILVGL